MRPKFTLRFYPVREAESRSGIQVGATHIFDTLGEIDDFLSRLTRDARDIVWVTGPDGKEAKYAAPIDSIPTPLKH